VAGQLDRTEKVVASFVSRQLGTIAHAVLVLAALSVSGAARGDGSLLLRIGTGAIVGIYQPSGL
jgi:hypothetical protein